MSMRIEKDTLGEMKLPAGALYGASTQRAVENFKISGVVVPIEIVHALVEIKLCAAEVNRDLGHLPAKHTKLIQAAAREVLKGGHDVQFVVDVFQTGSGTSTNMNVNEVLANLANQAAGSDLGAKSPVHPNDHVNLGQSSNDVFPSAIHMALVGSIHQVLLLTLEALGKSLEGKAGEFMSIVKIGRTHLQDATPLFLGQEFSGYAAQMVRATERLRSMEKRLLELALGGTAVGTGINTDPKFARLVCKKLVERTGYAFTEAKNHFEAQSARDACVELSGVLKTIAVSLYKIGNDIRLLASGPRSGLGELELPTVQPGSSIMPGKSNPVIIESLLQVCAQVVGNDGAVTWGGASGHFELNTMMPLIGYNLLQSIHWLGNVIVAFDEKCVRGITANRDRIASSVENSLMLVTALVPEIGYEKAAELANLAHKTGESVRTVVMRELKWSEEKIDKTLDPPTLCRPHS
ncbi:MAG: class II fumarate hydratase [Deltaproteobacteria bacterium]|nr:class II fumarate hydratase [Deltaproteobacteria bacterium]MBI3294567.1 class II fumarate hydratase [Deltaproteobacteria bacterium]